MEQETIGCYQIFVQDLLYQLKDTNLFLKVYYVMACDIIEVSLWMPIEYRWIAECLCAILSQIVICI